MTSICACDGQYVKANKFFLFPDQAELHIVRPYLTSILNSLSLSLISSSFHIMLYQLTR
uniref:Uncharacterized protein n=1 Tax=Oryza brachyantha TaxID=4533 RepID=J3KZ57_ORYBR